MKIALCFFGQPRFYDNQEIRDFLRDIRLQEGLEVDVYMHLWNPANPNDFLRSTWANIDTEFAKIDVENLKEKIEDIYEPIALDITNEYTFVPDPTKYKRTPSPTSPEIVHRMYYSQMKVAEMLKASGKEYDLVFRIRTDSAVMNLKPLSYFIGDKIWVPDNCPVYGWFNDNFSISSQENFYKMSKTFENLDKFYDQGVDMNGEPMLRAQVRNEGIAGKITKNSFVNVGLVRGISPSRLQGIWANGEFHQFLQVDKK